jgi:release factor glutamine methyltransferase
MSALIAGDDGLVDLREIVAGAPHWLRAGGLLVTEIGHTQASAVKELLHAAGLGELRVHRDLSGRDRFVSGVCS